jgi:outer membrane lipoprotein-sorting protein
MKWFSVLFAVAACTSLAHADSLPALLSRLDASAPSFKGVSANLQMVSHTAILDDNTTETGLFKLQRRKPSDVRAIIDFTGEKDKRTVAFAEHTVRVYYPNLALVQIYDLGRNVKLLDQYLLLGFGTSGKDLLTAYTITLLGSETVDGKPTTHLQLIPKDEGVLQRLAKAELWFPNDEGYPIQQKFYQPNGNYTLVTYEKVTVNPVFAPEGLELKVPADTRKETPK